MGDGVFVTARHVLDGQTVLSLGTTEEGYLPLEGSDADNAHTFVRRGDEDVPVHRISPRPLTIDRGPFFSLDQKVDIAVFGVAGLDRRTPFFEFGSHLDDWIGTSDFVLSEVLVLGYPPIPLARVPVLVATRAEVVAQIDRYDLPHVHFILSLMPRGGFSGGVAYSEWGLVLGALTQSLVADGKPEESGYFAVTSIEPIYSCLADHKLLPDSQAEHWDGLWNSRRLVFSAADATDLDRFRIVAGVEVFDDGKHLWIEFHCDDANEHRRLLQAAETHLSGARAEKTRPGLVRYYVEVDYTETARRTTNLAAATVVDHLVDAGYVAQGPDSPRSYFLE